MNVDNVAAVQDAAAVANPEVGTEVTQAAVAMPVAEGEVMYRSWYQTLSSYFEGYPSWVMEVGVFGVGALVLGVLLKNFGRYVIFGLVAAAVIIAALSYLHVISFSVMNLRQILGIQDIHSVQDFGTEFVAWAKTHVIACISAVVGFFVGWQLG